MLSNKSYHEHSRCDRTRVGKAIIGFLPSGRLMINDDNIRECFVCGTRCKLMISGLKHHTRLVEGHSICLDLWTQMEFFAFQHLMHFCGVSIVGVSVVHGLVTPGQGHASGL